MIQENYYQYLSKYLNESDKLDLVIAPSSVGITDAVLSSLIGKMIDLQLELKMIGGNLKLENPLVAEQIKRLRETKKDIVEAVQNLKTTSRIKNDYLTKQIETVEKQLGKLPSSERKYISIKRNYSLLDNLYIFLLQKKSEAGISKASSTSDIILVNPPMQAGGHISPKKDLNYAIAGFLGLAIPFFLFVLLEVFNTKIQSKEDVEKIIAVPFIGGVGHKQADDSLVVLNNPKSAVAESFRALRTNLNYFLSGTLKPVVMITSSISGEGKTFTTINLGSVVAMSRKRTLIIGADMRRPKIYADFNLTNDVGLSSYLAGLATFEEVVQKTKQENLFLVSGGPVPPNPAELLLSDRLQQFLEEAKSAFDFIIIDTPPMAVVTDALSLKIASTDHSTAILPDLVEPGHH